MVASLKRKVSSKAVAQRGATDIGKPDIAKQKKRKVKVVA